MPVLCIQKWVNCHVTHVVVWPCLQIFNSKQRLLICGQIMSCECCESFDDAVLGAVGIYWRQDKGTNASDKLKWFESKRFFCIFQRLWMACGDSEDILYELQCYHNHQRFSNRITFKKFAVWRLQCLINSVGRFQNLTVVNFLLPKGRRYSNWNGENEEPVGTKKCIFV